jgi:WD40 repeat protein
VRINISSFHQEVACLCALADGRVVSGSGDMALRVWDVASGECVRELRGHEKVSEFMMCDLLPDQSGCYKCVRVA